MVLNKGLRLLLGGLFYILCLFSLITLLHKFFYLGFNPIETMGVAFVLLVPLAIVLALIKPVSRLQAAIAIDDKLGLHERLSTALTVSEIDEPSYRAVVTDAQRHANEIKPVKHFPLEFPKETRWLPVPAIALIGIWGLMPTFDLFSREADAIAKAKEREAMKIEAETLKARSRQLRKRMEKVQSEKTKKLVQQLYKASNVLKKAKDKKEGFLKLSEVGDKLKNRQEELKKILAANKRFQPGSLARKTRELQDALSHGDYAKAKSELEKIKKELREKAKKGELSKDDLKGLSRELDALSKNMPEMTELARNLKHAAEAFGQSEPRDLEKALKELEMTEEQLADLERLMEEMELIELAMKEIDLAKDALAGKAIFSKDCPSCGQKLCRNCGTDDCKCCAEQELTKCKFAMGRGGLASGRGKGSGRGRGRGRGLRPRGAADGTQFEKSKVKGQLGKGPILGAFTVKGLPPKGNTNVEYSDVVTRYKEAAEEALDKERIPANYRDLVRNYFESIENPSREP